MLRAGTTRWHRWPGAFGQAGAVGLICLAVVAGEDKPVREKIQFSGAGGATALPSSRPKDDSISKPLDFLGKGDSISGVAPALAPSALPIYQRNAHLQLLLEMQLDQKRNWIFGQPADFGRAPTTEEVFGIGALGDSETKPKTALERFLAGSDSKPARGHGEHAGTDADKRSLDKPDSRFDRDERPRDDLSSPLTNPYESSRVLSAGFSFANDFLGFPTSPNRLNGFLNTSPADPAAKAREDRKHADEFRRSLDFSGPANPLTTSLPSLRLGLGPVSPELSPVPVPRLGELPGIGRDAYNPLRGINGLPASRPGGLDDQAAKILGPSSLAPAVSAPSDSSVRQPAPAVLEFPKRRF